MKDDEMWKGMRPGITNLFLFSIFFLFIFYRISFWLSSLFSLFSFYFHSWSLIFFVLIIDQPVFIFFLLHVGIYFILYLHVSAVLTSFLYSFSCFPFFVSFFILVYFSLMLISKPQDEFLFYNLFLLFSFVFLFYLFSNDNLLQTK